MTIVRGTESPAAALAKIAHLTSLFERLVTDAGLRRAQIEQLLADIAAEQQQAKVASPAPAQRAA